MSKVLKISEFQNMQIATSAADHSNEIAIGLCGPTGDTDSQMSFVTSCEEFAFRPNGFNSIRAAVRSGSAYRNQSTEWRRAAFVFSKRMIDITISLMALVVLSPVFAVAAVMIKWHDGGPIFFSQERVGKDRKVFRCFKFRSMMVNAESLRQSLMEQSKHADRRTFKMCNDPRITPPGRFMRRFSIDELPQIFNVLSGDMSIVGPRPPLPVETKLYKPSDMRRLAVKPGLTCIWQISGRSRLPFPEQVKLDVEYIRKQSLWLDLAIILRTVPAVLSGDGAE